MAVESDLPSAEGMEEVVFTGEGTGSEVTLGTEAGTCIMDNAEGVLLSINGEETAYTEAG